MTRTTNARIAGVTYFVYFAAGIASLLLWLPALVFELTLAVWLIVKGVDTPAQRQSA